MERKTIWKGESMQRLDDFKYATVDRQRFLVHARKISSVQQVIRYETEEKLCWFLEECRPRFGTVGFVQRLATDGFSFDKKKKKLSVWFGKSFLKISSLLISQMMKDIGVNWYDEMPYVMRGLSVRMIFEKIIKSKIGSPFSFVESYVKYHLKVKGVDPVDYYKLLLGKTPNVGNGGIGLLNDILRHSSDPNWVVKNYDNIPTLSSMHAAEVRDYCKILGKKFDWSVSIDEMMKQKKQLEAEIAVYEQEYKTVQEFYEYIEPETKSLEVLPF